MTTAKQTNHSWRSSLPATVCYIVALTMLTTPLMLQASGTPSQSLRLPPLRGTLAIAIQLGGVLAFACVALHRGVTAWLATRRAWLWLAGTTILLQLTAWGLGNCLISLQALYPWVGILRQVVMQLVWLGAFVLLASKLVGFAWSNRCLGYAACFVALPLLQQFLLWSFYRHYTGPQMTSAHRLTLFFWQGMLSIWLDERTVYFWIHVLKPILALFICYTMAKSPHPTVAPFLLTDSQAKGRRQLHSWLAVWGGLYLTTQIFMTIDFGIASLDTWCFWIGLGLLLAADFRQVRGRWIAATVLSSVWWIFWLFAASRSLSETQNLLKTLHIWTGNAQNIVAIILCILMSTQEGDLGDYRFYLSESPPSLQRRRLSVVGQGLFWSGLIFILTTIALLLISGESTYWFF